MNNGQLVVAVEMEKEKIPADVATRVRILRETVRPSSFDEWVCLGGEYRDMVEVEEWAPDGERRKLLADYREFESMYQLA